MSGSGDPLDDALRSLVDRGRVEDAVAMRRRRNSLHRQAAESGTFIGAMTDLAERGATVAIVSGDGHRSRGRIDAIGADFIELVDERHRRVLVCLTAAVMVHSEPDSTPTVGDRTVDRSVLLMDVLSERAGRPVTVRTIWDESIAGTLTAVGTDVLRIRTDTGRAVYLSRSGITEVAPD